MGTCPASRMLRSARSSSRHLAGFGAAGLGLAMLAACSGHSARAGYGPSSQAGRVMSVPGPVRPQQKPPASRQQLKKIVVQASDLPRGWQAGPYTGPDQATADAVDAECMGVRDTTPDVVAEVRSDQYAHANVQVNSIAASYRSERDLDVDFGQLTNPRLSFCTALFDRKILEALGFKIESISTRAKPAPAGSQANVVGVVDTTVTGSLGGNHVVHDRIVVISGPHIEAQVEIASADTPIPQHLLNSLVAAVASRAATAS